jgi:hypothetical protein
MRSIGWLEVAKLDIGSPGMDSNPQPLAGRRGRLPGWPTAATVAALFGNERPADLGDLHKNFQKQRA